MDLALLVDALPDSGDSYTLTLWAVLVPHNCSDAVAPLACGYVWSHRYNCHWSWLLMWLNPAAALYLWKTQASALLMNKGALVVGVYEHTICLPVLSMLKWKKCFFWLVNNW